MDSSTSCSKPMVGSTPGQPTLPQVLETIWPAIVEGSFGSMTPPTSMILGTYLERRRVRGSTPAREGPIGNRSFAPTS